MKPRYRVRLISIHKAWILGGRSNETLFYPKMNDTKYPNDVLVWRVDKIKE